MIRTASSFLLYACGVLFAAYLALVASTMYFAHQETLRTDALRSTEAKVASLEARYYAAVEVLGKVRPETLGFVTPRRVSYVSKGGTPVLSRADR